MDDAPPSSHAVKPGDIIAGKYRVERVLASGGMGSVVKARHEVLHQDVAIKLMHQSLAGSDMARRRFLREARAAAKISSDYVARVTDVDVLPNGTPLMVMEFLDGEELHAIMRRNVRLPVKEAVDYVVQALVGLQAAHDIGVVHRDLKPSNLFVTEGPGGQKRVKLLDFGISKVLEEAASEALRAGASTGAHTSLGTPRYMSPEQIRSAKDVDERTDLWSAGLILYQAVTGSFPFEGDTAGEVLANVMTVSVPKLSAMTPDAPAGLSEVVDRCLMRDRDDRYASAQHLIKALAPFASKRIQASLASFDTARPSASARPPSRPASGGGTIPTEDATKTAISTGADTVLSPEEPSPDEPSPDDAQKPGLTATDMTIEDTWTAKGGRLWAVAGLLALGVCIVAVASWLSSPAPVPASAQPSATGAAEVPTAPTTPTAPTVAPTAPTVVPALAASPNLDASSSATARRGPPPTSPLRAPPPSPPRTGKPKVSSATSEPATPDEVLRDRE